MFQSFLKGLAAVVPKKAPPVHVVVVYFAEETPEDETNRASVEQLLEFYQHNHGFGFTYVVCLRFTCLFVCVGFLLLLICGVVVPLTVRIKVLMQPFSRGVGLETGAYAAAGDNPHALLFFCDVDMKFNADFLYRCRVNPVEGKRVYFPIVFSLYRNKVSLTRVWCRMEVTVCAVFQHLYHLSRLGEAQV